MQDYTHFLIYLSRGLTRYSFAMHGCRASQKHLIVTLVIEQWPHFFRKPPLCHHITCDFGRALNIVLGILVGWIVMGRRAGRGTTSAINNGLTGVFVLMLWGVGIQSANEMVRLAMRNRYDGPFEAIIDTFQIGAEFVMIIATVPIGVTLVIAAVLSGLVTEFAGNRWR